MHPNPDLIALSIQQPWAELILQGVKTVEIRSVSGGANKIIYLYSSQTCSAYIDAQTACEQYHLKLEDLPRGQIVGTVQIVESRPCLPSDASAACLSWSLMENRYSWVLNNPIRCTPPIAPRYLPYGMWFYPFKRKDRLSRERRKSTRN